MTQQQENELRRKINSNGFKLKYDGKQYFVKGRIGKVHETFEKLELVEKWIDEKIADDKCKKEEYRDRIAEISKTAIFPEYSDKCKDIFFQSIREHRISDSLEQLEEIFDESSELYEEPFAFDVESILSNINENQYYHCSLEDDVECDINNFYYKEVMRLNPDIEEDDICELVGYESFEYWTNLLEHITVEELKKFVFDLKKNEDD